MANPHHRAKHKSYVHQKHMMQQHHQHEQAVPEKATKKAFLTLAITGALASLLIGYIANKGSITTLIVCGLVGALAGYMFGTSIDRTVAKKK